MMKDKVPGPHVHGLHGLPPCPLSIHCFRLIDEVEGRNNIYQSGSMYIEDGIHDMQLVEQLRSHIPGCPTCIAALEEARALRARQRSMLRGVLNEGEQRVPSTHAQIFAAMAREQKKQKPGAFDYGQSNHHQRTTPLIVPLPSEKRAEDTTPIPLHSRTWLRNAFSLVAVAVIVIASLGLFGFLVRQRSTMGNHGSPPSTSGSTSQPGPITTASGWSSAIVSIVRDGKLTIANVDPLSGKSVELASSDTLDTNAQLQLQGISHDGTRLLYSVFDGVQTTYTLDPQSPDKALYTFPGKAENAVWSTDDRYIFISTPKGVVQVDTVSHTQKMPVPDVQAPDLKFYYANYLYYVDGNDTTSKLNRVNVDHRTVDTVTTCSGGKNFTLSPTGKMIHYVCGENDALNEVNIDGSNKHVLRQASTLAGYAQQDSAPLVIQQTNATFQVVRLGQKPEQDVVQLDGLAQHSQAENPIAVDAQVAPYKEVLLAQAQYADKHQEVWYADLTTHQQRKIDVPAADSVTVVGWDTLPVSGSPVSSTPTGSQNFSDWHNVLFATSNTAGWNIINDLDTRDGSVVKMSTGNIPAQSRVDGVSSDGKHILYHYANNKKTTYWVLTQPGPGELVGTVNDDGAGNALWLADNRTILIAGAGSGLLKIDIQTKAIQVLLPKLNTSKLAFYRAPFVYFIGAEDLADGALYRIDSAGGTPQQVTPRSPGSTFWLSPDGTTVYYANNGPSGRAGVYAVNADGSNLHLVNNSGLPIGYAADDTLLIMQQVGSKFQIVKPGKTPQIVLDDVVPGAITLCQNKTNVGVQALCDENIALAPLGSMLVVEAGYADGSNKLWFIDLATKQHVQLSGIDLSPPMHIRLVGWDSLQH